MKVDEFEGILDAQIKRVRDILLSKRDEYAKEQDVLINFKRSAHMRNCGMPQAISGMMVKHTTSIYDMIESSKPYPIEVWDEKITDHICYLILLRASLIDNAQPY
ncbi:MAG TPA: hypothetical protein VN843_31945 [Anaerolineales bacterium]|nr:hypothetical protein [Anaerolineales bacterium]